MKRKVLAFSVIMGIYSGLANAGGEPAVTDLFDYTISNPTAEDLYQANQFTLTPPAPVVTQSSPTTPAKQVVADAVIEEEKPQAPVVMRREVAGDLFADEFVVTAAKVTPEPVIEKVVEPSIANVSADLFGPATPNVVNVPQTIEQVTPTSTPSPVESSVTDEPLEEMILVEDDSADVSTSVQRRLLSGESEEEVAIFEAALMESEPFSPGEIRAYKRHLDTIAEAQAEKPRGEPIRNTRSVNVSLAPGADIPEILVSSDYVSSVVIMDRMGNPWPIKGYARGNSEAFLVTSAGDNILLVSPTKRYATGNIIVTLEGISVPVVFQLRNSPEMVDLRLGAKIQAVGPNSNYDPNTDLAFMPGGQDVILQSVLDGIPDKSLTELDVTGGSRYTQGWKDKDGSVYLRTPYEIKVPEVRRQSKSSDGTHVFVFDSTPVATLSVGGRPVLIDIKEKDL